MQRNWVKEFQLKTIHRIVVTKKVLFKYGSIKPTMDAASMEKKTLAATRLLIALSLRHLYKK